MIDFLKPIKSEQVEKNISEVVNKSKDIAVKTVDFQNAMFKESLKFFNDVTDKYFYTYTSKLAEAADQSVGYAKEYIQTGTVKTVFANSAKN